MFFQPHPLSYSDFVGIAIFIKRLYNKVIIPSPNPLSSGERRKVRGGLLLQEDFR